MIARSLLIVLVGLVVWGVARPQGSLPPYQRLLQSDDARRAAELEKRREEFEAADTYAEALKAAEELLTLRRRVQGKEHWETVNARWATETLRKVAALSTE